jgi:uncharacterized membrane protein YeaQ/YmgE (transglycosylase-associated protein family)
MARSSDPGQADANPEEERTMGVRGWTILGLVAGAIAGGLIASAVGIGSVSSFFSLGTWLIAIGGALLLLVIYDALSRRSDSHGRRRAAT